MKSRKGLAAGALAAVCVAVTAPSAVAEPLTPLTRGELQFLEHARQVLPAAHDPVAFRSDGELLRMGRFVCARSAEGFVGPAATLTSPVINQLAPIYLCP